MNRWGLMLLLVLCGLVVAFWTDLAQQLADVASHMTTPMPSAMPDELMEGARGAFVRDTESEVPAAFETSALEIAKAAVAGGMTTLSFRLASRAGTTSYPTVKLTLLSSKSKVLRAIYFLPDLYTHGLAPGDEVVHVSFRPGIDEANLELRAIDLAMDSGT
jgi:hypothetical protein